METERLIFEKFKKSDFKNYFCLMGDENVMKMITGKAFDETEAKKRFAAILETYKDKDQIGYFKVSMKINRQFIGFSKIVVEENNQAEIGYCLLPEFWGKGFGYEISEKLVRHSKSFDSIQYLIANIDPENSASRKILLKSKFQLTGKGLYIGLPAEFYNLNLRDNL